MNNKSVLILGSGHLAHRTKKLVADKGISVIHLSENLPGLTSGENSTIEETRKALAGINVGSLNMTYVLYEHDADNLEMVIAMMALYPHIPIATSLFNENIRPHLETANPKLKIINPARIAAPKFVEALDVIVDRKLIIPSRLHVAKRTKYRSDSLIIYLIAAFALIAFGAAAYFHFNEHLTWLDSFYFVVVTISTVGYGDISLQQSGSLSKLIGIGLIICSAMFIWLIFSLLIDRIIKRRAQYSLGRKSYPYKNHIILCGLGRLGYFIAEELLKKGEQFLIIESNEESANSDYFRKQNVDVYIGNARLPAVLKDAGARHCKALISVINDDYVNLEIGLNARYFQPNLRLILRIFDESMAHVIKDKFDIHLTQSMSFLATESFAALLDESS